MAGSCDDDNEISADYLANIKLYFNNHVLLLCFRLPVGFTRKRSAHACGSCNTCGELREEPKRRVSHVTFAQII
jgi:hypothetical protein